MENFSYGTTGTQTGGKVNVEWDPKLCAAENSISNPPRRDMHFAGHNQNNTFGLKTEYDDKAALGHADFVYSRHARFSDPFEPNYHINNVSPSHSFGIQKRQDNLPECISTFEMHQEKVHFEKCLTHLNSLRTCLKTCFDESFFNELYLKLKNDDKSKSGWLPKEVVYQCCFEKLIHFDTSLIESILATWNAFDGTQIEYKTFVLMLNHTLPTPETPVDWDLPGEVIDYRTTYSEMVKPGQKPDMRLVAGLPSGSYFAVNDPMTPLGCCRADRVYLPHESDARCCLTPSIFTMLGVSHQDMYVKREPQELRKIFEAALKGKFRDDDFDSVWQKAKGFHTEGWVSFETFRKALYKLEDNLK